MIQTETYSAKYYMNQICKENLIDSFLINYLKEKQSRGMYAADEVIWSLCPKSGIWRSQHPGDSRGCLFTEIKMSVCPSLGLYYFS